MADPVLGFADLAGRSVGIFGFGVEGQAAAAQLRRRGIEPVIVDDRGPSAGDGVLATMSGGLEALASCDVVLKTPGLSTYADSVSSLRSRGVLVTSALSCWLTDADRSRVVLITGTKGKLLIGTKGADAIIDGEKRWRWKGQKKDMYQIEHDELFAAIRHGEVINNGDRMMNSTLVAILGRTAAYTGKRITWDEMVKSTLDLAPEETLKWGDKFEPTPLPKPGVTTFA